MSSGDLGSWSLSSDLWRVSSRISLDYVNWGFKAIGANRLSTDSLGRLYTLGVPPEIVQQTLKAIRGLDDWSHQWVETAQHFLGMARRETSAGNLVEAERSRYQAAMCYHIAQILELNDLKTRDSCRAWSASLAKRSLPVRNEHARHFMIPWNDRELPVLFEVPEVGEDPFGLVVLLNGLSQSKEETFNWAPRFLQAGYAVMAIDSPGTGEATSLGPVDAGATDILDGVFGLFRRERSIDLNRVVVIGASLGGNEALRIARRHPDIMAVVAITPAVQPARWMDHASPLLTAELADIAPDRDRREVAESFDALAAAESGTQPVLIFGAGRDLVVPPNESQILAERVGERATLAWYPDLGHCLYLAADQWTFEAAAWMTAIGEARSNGVLDPGELSAIGRNALLQAQRVPMAPPVQEWEEEDSGEYARLLSPEEIES